METDDQNPDTQLKTLPRAGRQKIFKHELSGATTKRPAHRLETRPIRPQLARPRRESGRKLKLSAKPIGRARKLIGDGPAPRGHVRTPERGSDHP
jgi:hypothetical protein